MEEKSCGRSKMPSTQPFAYVYYCRATDERPDAKSTRWTCPMTTNHPKAFESLLVLAAVSRRALSFSLNTHGQKLLDTLHCRDQLDAILGKTPPTLEDPIGLFRLFEGRDPVRTTISSSYLGHPIAFAISARSIGIRLTLIHDAISDDYAKALRYHDVRCIDIRTAPSALSIIQLAHNHAKSGYIPVFVSDAPVTLGVGTRFLGFDIQCSQLGYLYAKRYRCDIVHTHNIINSSGLSWLSDSEAECANNLYSGIKVTESLVIGHPEQYKWLRESIFFSDPTFVQEVVSVLLDVQQWMKVYAK